MSAGVTSVGGRGAGLARIGEMWRAGGRALRERWRLAVALYAVQLWLALVFMLAVARTFTVLFGDRPFFDRAIAGDPIAFLAAMADQPGAFGALAATGVALAVGYAVLSWYLSAGTLGALAGESFTDAAGDRFFAYVRIWLWSIVPYLLAFIVTFAGAGAVVAARPSAGGLTWFDFAGRPLLGALPGLLLFGVTTCVVNYAQAILAAERKRGATRAFFRAWRLVFTRPWPLIHYFIYVLLWALVSVLYFRGTLGTDFSGAGGAIALFAIRQLVAITRFLLRFATTAGQLSALRTDL